MTARSWIFSKEELEQLLPSRKDGISFEEEINHREIGIEIIRSATKILQLYVGIALYSVQLIISNVGILKL